MPRIVVPRTAAQHTLLALSLRPRAAIIRRSEVGVRVVPAVLNPLPDVAKHVVKAKAVVPETADWCSLCMAVGALVVSPANLDDRLARPIMDVREATRVRLMRAGSSGLSGGAC